MGEPISLENRRTDLLADVLDQRIAPDADFFVQPIGEIDDLDRWRRAARLVGQRRGWTTRTGVNDRCVWVVDEKMFDGNDPPLQDEKLIRQLEQMIQETLDDTN
jgi:hypothetical protein